MLGDLKQVSLFSSDKRILCLFIFHLNWPSEWKYLRLRQFNLILLLDLFLQEGSLNKFRLQTTGTCLCKMHDHTPGSFGFSYSKVIIFDLIVPAVDNLSALNAVIPLGSLTFRLVRFEESKVFPLVVVLHAAIVMLECIALS